MEKEHKERTAEDSLQVEGDLNISQAEGILYPTSFLPELEARISLAR